MRIFEKIPKVTHDPRVKKRSFSWQRFLGTFLILLSLAIGQTLFVSKYYDSNAIPPILLNSIIWYWAIVSAIYSWFSTIGVRFKYEKPMRKICNATRQVASGDFSVQLKPQHNEDQLNYIDVAFLDFNKMVEELSSIEILKNDFIANVSHEIKTPLSVIQNYAMLLQTDHLTEAQRKEYSIIIFQAAGQLSTLITNILRLSKLENQAMLPEPQPYDVCRQLGDCVMNFAEQLEQKQLEFSAEIEDKALVMADESMVEIVWNNLLTNAIKFTEPGGKITLTQVTKNTDVWITIADTGCGMDEQTSRRIFDKFYQGDTSHSQDGYGLGLALTKKVLDLNNGKIEVISTPGKGSKFSVCLKRGF